MRLLAPRLNNRNLIFSAPLNQHWPRPRPLLENQPWEEHCSVTLLRSSPILQTPADYKLLHIHTHTHIYAFIYPHPRSLASVALNHQPDKQVCDQRREMAAGLDGCLPELDYFPCCKVVCLWCIMCFCCWGVFSCSHTVLPKSIVWGLFFFSSPSSCYAVFFFNSLSSCPVYPLVIYVCCVWTGWWLISLVLVTSDNKGLLLSIVLSIVLSIYLSISIVQSFYLSFYHSVCHSIYLSVVQSFYLSFYHSVCHSVYICPSVLSVYCPIVLSVILSIFVILS